MANGIETGFDVTLYRVTGGTCTTSNDVVSLSGGTCTVVGYMNTANYSTSTNMIDYTSFGDTINKEIPGFAKHTYSFSGTLAPGNAPQTALMTAAMDRTLTSIRAKYADSKQCRSGHGYVSNYSESASVGDKVGVSFDFSFTSKPKTCTYT